MQTALQRQQFDYSWVVHKRRTALYQGIFATSHRRKGATSTHRNCIKDGVFIDPCMGSGHVLVYAFDVLMQIYVSEGYTGSDAAALILEKNIHGLEIDRRAYQLAYFALMMKARQFSRRILTMGIRPQVFEPTGYEDGMEYGSLARVEDPGPAPVKSRTMLEGGFDERLNAWNFRRLLAQKYDAVVTNPPYMGASGMGGKLSEYVKKNFPDSKSDLFAVFIERCAEMLKAYGYQAMITQQAWMFLSSYEKLRVKLLRRDIVSMAHLGVRAFEDIGGEVVQTTAFVMAANKTAGYLGTYERLVDFGSQNEKEAAFLSSMNYHFASVDMFNSLPGSSVAYWASSAMLRTFSNCKLSDICETRKGLATSDNERFLRLWYEVSVSNISVLCNSNEESKSRSEKWFPINKGGEFRRYYGNNEYVINWQYDGFEIRNFRDTTGKLLSRPQNLSYNFKHALTWTKITSSIFSARMCFGHYLFDDSSAICYHADIEQLTYIAGLLNTKCCNKILTICNPTMNIQIGDIGNLSIIETNKHDVVALVKVNIALCRADWDSFETSWDFTRHPLLMGYGLNPKTMEVLAFQRENKLGNLEYQYDMWRRLCDNRFNSLKANEEELNRIFIDIYGLQDELTPEVEDRDVTVRKADRGREIRSLISYAVGCMLGRYSPDQDGIAYAGGEWDASKYKTFPAEPYNILPVCDDEYFSNDVTARFIDFIRDVFGAGQLEDNLEYIANALGGKGSPRTVIRNYFLSGFYADHLKTYRKRPIYWMFDSGKKNGFKALVYMHRYSRDLLARLRTDYVLEQQERYRSELAHIVSSLEEATGPSRVRLMTRQEKLTGQAKELGEFEEKIHHLADQMIAIDLDDGVKRNHALFGDVLAGIK